MKRWQIGLLAITGLVVFVVAIFIASIQGNSNIGTKSVFVPKDDIPMYTVITNNEIKETTVDAGIDTSLYATTREAIIGRIAGTKLYKETLIPKDGLKESKDVRDFVYATIHTDYVKSGGAQNGDVVDVYKVTRAFEGAPFDKVLVASGITVASITDGNGGAIAKKSGGYLSSSNSSGTVQAIRLVVPVELQTYFLDGAVDSNNGYVLLPSVSSGITTAVAPKATIETETSSEQNSGSGEEPVANDKDVSEEEGE